MADDIDDLLDECETKFFDSGKKPKQEPTTKLNSSLSSETGKTSRYKDRKPKTFLPSLPSITYLFSLFYFE